LGPFVGVEYTFPSSVEAVLGLQDLRFGPDGEPTESSGLPKPEYPALSNDGTGLTFLFLLEVLESSECRDPLPSGGLKLNRDATGA
jgi:hypothetical protein